MSRKELLRSDLERILCFWPLNKLVQFMHRCVYKSGVDTVLLVGDLVGKGPNSVQVSRLSFYLLAVNKDISQEPLNLQLGHILLPPCSNNSIRMQVLRDAQRNGYKVVRGNWDENALAAFARTQASSAEYEVRDCTCDSSTRGHEQATEAFARLVNSQRLFQGMQNSQLPFLCSDCKSSQHQEGSASQNV